MTNASSATLTNLLSHAGFLRGLARALLRGDDRVEDVVQETWVAVLSNGPTQAGRERGWLASVLRRRVARVRRGDARTSRALRRVPGPATELAAADALARTETIGRVTTALLALPETYRQAVVLRFYDDLPPSRIAERLGIPVETARTHVRRGLERLRVALDARHDGDRRAWAVALATFFDRPRRPGPLVAAAVALAVGAGGTWALARGDASRGDPGRLVLRDALASAADRAPLGHVLAAAPPPNAPAAPAGPPAPPAPAAPSAAGIPIAFGRVTSLGGQPIADAEIEARGKASSDVDDQPEGWMPDAESGALLGRARSDGDGRFRIEVPEGARAVLLTVRAQGFATPPRQAVRVGARAALVLDRGGALDVTVRAANGAPVATDVVAVPFDEWPRPAVTSDAEGRARIEGLPAGPCVLAVGPAGGPRTTQGGIEVLPGDRARVEVRLRPSRVERCRGRVLDGATGQAVAGASVRLTYVSGLLGTVPTSAGPEPAVTTAVDGSFDLPVDATSEGPAAITVLATGFDPGIDSVALDGPTALWRSGRPAHAPMSVTYAPGTAPPAPSPVGVARLIRLHRATASPGPVHGRVLTSDGKPAAGVHVAWNGASPTCLTESDGTFVLDRGAPSFVDAVIAQARDGELGVRVVKERDPEAVLELQLVAGVEAHGKVLGPDGAPVVGAEVAWKRAGNVDFRPGLPPEQQVANLLRLAPWQVGFSTVTDAAGTFVLRCVPPGPYVVSARAPGVSAPPLDLVVSTSGAPDATLQLTPARVRRGRVLDREGHGVPGARVWAIGGEGAPQGVPRLHPTWSRSDGSFALPGVPDAPVEVRARHPRLGSGVATPSDVADVDVILK